MAPSIVLVPGMASVGNVFYMPLKLELEKLGYTEVIIVEIPSVDSESRLGDLRPNPLEADIKHIRQILTNLLDGGKDVVIVAHSYGGTPSLYASEGLWKHARSGDSGGVIKAVLLSSSLTMPGHSVGGERAQWAAVHMPELLKAQESARIETVEDIPFLHPEGMEQAFFADMNPEEQKLWAAKGLRPNPLGTVMAETPQATTSDWRVAYLLTEELDPSMPLAFQQFLIDQGRKHGVAIEQTKKMKSGHFVQVTHSEEVAKWVNEITT
ncbi:uncharacterized protein PV09_08979 [Verruconis gallopava]|uniref:AB hydrolase-1 domain-containing protein n=1 Tax=Verruconis gallopava TaxID=253628 RepID=A0A0D1ZZ13_9PEZI|nr:uncharacterized protein PV09_08979 [Verruconis gallopava]KIV99319.1 hypothetical protein PV09_08979 [Verruconis gallopava]